MGYIVKRYFFFFLLPFSLFALNGEPDVVAGSARHEVSGSCETVHVTDKTILHYKTFNLAENEGTAFVQPSTKSTLLCRVKGRSPSTIEGRLDANGRLLFINPNGIVFSKTAKVNVGSLIASTLDIQNNDFLNDHFRFTLSPDASSSFIIHKGEINAASNVVLMAPYLTKSGAISAKMGKIALLGGEIITLDFEGDRKMSFAVEAPLQKGAMELSGVYSGKEVIVKLQTAGEIIKSVLQIEGAVEAGKISIENGVVRLIESQKISLGPIHCQADRIEVGGDIETKNTSMTLDGPVLLVNKDTIHLSTGRIRGDIVFGGPLDAGASSLGLSIQNENAATYFKGDIGKNGPLTSLRVNSGKTVFQGDVGGVDHAGVEGLFSLEKKSVYCEGAVYHTGEQNWNVRQIHMTHEGPVQIKTAGQNIQFGREAEIVLEKTGGMSIHTQGGKVDLGPIIADRAAPVSVLAGDGTAHLKEVGGNVFIFQVEAKEIWLAEQIEGAEIFLEAQRNLAYKEGTGPILIKSSGTITLNSKQGAVGSASCPLHVETTQKCFVGAREIAYVQGVCEDQIPHDYSSNPPPRKVFNGFEYNTLLIEYVDLKDESLLNSLTPVLLRKKPTSFIEGIHLAPKKARIYYEQK